MPSLTPNLITLDAFNEYLAQYPASVPEKLRDLDRIRYDSVPVKIAERNQNGGAYMTKDEVAQLVEWKVKHGTFRPKLLQLVQSNPADQVGNTTRQAFAELDTQNPLPALKTLTQLKGIGPATASLLLSVFAAEDVPFFSDELLRWCMWDEGEGWKRKIKYDIKEYAELAERIREVRKRLDVSAVEMERVAWVLGRNGVDMPAGSAEGVHVKKTMDKESNDKKTKMEKLRKAALGRKKGVKRKTSEVDASLTGVRRSSRRTTSTKAHG
ncbi:hypothetical protein BCR34DRAFT_496052 [Clohesyomyces aquaticus]|uniref:DNA glycosylase n=1 Tax=Clohesyomyces aquaticus TaxID=1231657 RepID=A0A1Y1YKJ9_9PLEO|nr:hypothetical protein BCR34DRAFT_496052 [Clohesyomyces aquaticus]